ncbi:MAG: TonB-dependent receptor domain-containing protein [Gemmatimonadota bacterium]
MTESNTTPPPARSPNRRVSPTCAGFLLAALLLGPIVLPGLGAQQTGAVEGRVVAAESGTPLPGVEVALEGGEDRTLSDTHGYYALPALPAGDVVLTFQRLGYASVREEVTVQAGERAVADIRLASDPIGLDPMLIHSRRTRMVGDPLNLSGIPGSAQFLSRQDLEARKLPHDNVHDILRRIPGVNVQEEEGYGLRPNIGLRGTGVSRSSKITLMEDGVLIAPAPYAAPAAYYFPVVGRMDAVEVRKGSSQIRYGPRTIGGAINFVSGSIPQRTSWELDTQGGENRTLKVRLRGGNSTDHFGWMVETYQLRTDGFKELQDGEDTGFRLSDYTLKLRANTDRETDTYQELELKLGYHDELSDETYLGLTHEDFQATPLLRYSASAPDQMDTEHRQVQLRHFLQTAGGLDLTTTAYHNAFARNWYKLGSVSGVGISAVLDDPETYGGELAIVRGGASEPDALSYRANNREYYSQGLQSVLGVRIDGESVRHDVEVGLRLHRDEEDRFQWEDGYQMVSGTPVRTSEGIPGTQANRVSAASAVSAYLQDQVRLGERWSVVPGVRYEHITLTRTDYPTDPPSRSEATREREATVSTVTPGVGAVFAVDPATHVFGGVHRGFSPPGPGADEETRPEESVNYEAGVRLRRGGLGLELVGFFSDYRNILGQETLATGETGAGDMFNGGAVHTSGLEASLAHDLSWGRTLPVRLPVDVSYTYTRGVFRTAFESDYGPWGTVEEGDRLPYLPEHQLSGSLSVEDAGWNVTLSASAASAMRTRAGSGEPADREATDGFVILNLEAGYELSGLGGGTLYAGLQNLMDRHYVVARRPAGARPGLPRTLFVGVRVHR